MPGRYLTTTLCLISLTSMHRPQKPAQVSLRNAICQGRLPPNQLPPSQLMPRRQYPIALSVRHRSTPYMLVHSSSYSHMTKCCLPFAQAMFVLTASSQGTSQRVVGATITAGNAKSHTTLLHQDSKSATENKEPPQ